MRQSLKISLSLLIALVVFAAFSVLAFRGLFDYLQASFFQPQVLRQHGEALEAAAGAVLRYHERNAERFRAVLREPYIAGAFSSTGQQSREDIFNRGNLFGRLLEEYPNLLGVRFLDPDGERVHFSTFAQDSTFSADRKSVTYLDFSKSEPALKGAPLVARAGEEPRLLLDAGGGRLVYSLAVSDARGSHRGTALFFLAAADLQAALAREPGSAARGLLLVDRAGVLVNFPDTSRQLLASGVAASWASRPRPAEGFDTLQFEGQAGSSRYLLLSRPAGRYGLVGWLVPYSAIELQPLLKIMLLAALLLTVFLVVFLVFNIRQDPLVVQARRIKRFQLEVLSDLLDGKERLDWKRWREQLTANRPQLRSKFMKGLGRIPAGKQAAMDELIDRGWDEIIGIIEARIAEHGKEKVAISQIEEMIQKALDRGRITVAGTLPAAPPTLPAETQARKPAPAPRRQNLVVEEIGVEEVSELTEAEPETTRQPALELPTVTSAEVVEEAEEAEAVEEVEALEEAGRQPAIAAAVEEAEEAEEAEEVEALEEAGRQPAVSAAIEVGGEPAPPAEEIIEEIFEEVEAPGPAAEEPAIAAVEAEHPAEKATPVEPTLEELEIVGDFVVLPPEPQEKLEELPEVEEAAPAAPAARPQAAELPPEMLENLEVLEEVVEEPGETAEEALEEAPEAELENAEAEPRTIQELLESPAELEIEEMATGRQPADELAQLDRLISQGALRAFSLAELEAQIQELRTSVVMENGVYRVKEEVRLAKGSAVASPGRGLMALAEAALSTGGEEESGIGALLGTGSGVDLSDELRSPAVRGRFLSYAELRQAKRINFANGLDYDQFLTQFRVGASETGHLKSLVEISRKLKAVNAALLVKTGDAYVSRLRIGLLERPARILFSAGEAFYDRFLSPRQAVLLTERPQAIPSLAARFNPEDLKYMQMALFLPAIYQKTEAVLFLGLATKRPLVMKDVIQALEIHIS
ncbi:MAG: hypothetical protein A2V99_15440 [Spirochaetes bacterium RBG_16_67_19]|nr:MAG: hypothetical protein A2V99_15440 [Spirochaetes bacterium RBG_16_67_19]